MGLPEHQAEGVRRDGTACMEQAARTDWHAAIGHDVREAPAETLHAVEVGGAWACPAHWTGGARDRAVLEADEALGGAGAPADRGGTGGAGGGSVGRRRTLDVPGEGPALGGAGRQQAGVAPVGLAERTVKGGEGLHRDQDVGSSGSPGRAGLCEATARHAGVEVGVVRELSSPGGQDTQAPREVGADATCGGGEARAGERRGGAQGVVGEAVRRAEQGAEGRGDGKGAEQGRPGTRSLQVVLKPLLACMLLPRGTGPVATGMLDAGVRATPVALREAGARGPAVARVDGAADLAVCEGQRGGARQGCWRTSGAASAAGRHGRSPGLRAWRRSEAAACPVWVRGRETSVVARWGGPKERWRSRGCTPAARRWGAEAGRRGGRATPVVVLPARGVAVRKAPWTRLRRLGDAARGLGGCSRPVAGKRQG